MLSGRLLLWALLWLCGGFPAFAAEHFSDHEEFCLREPATPCLQFIRQQRDRLPAQSVAWFKLTSYQLDYLYDKHQFSELLQQTEQLLQLPDLPAVFRTQLYFYHAKMLNAAGRLVQAQHYAELASAQLSDLYRAFADPLRMLELANLQTVFGAQDSAWTLLLAAEQRFGKSKDPIFIFELNSNKALVQHARGELEDAAYYRKLALDAILPSGHPGKIIVAYGNLARTHQLLGQLGLAINYYEKSLPYMRKDLDSVQQSIHVLRLAELYDQLQDRHSAQRYLQQVEPQLLSDGHRALHRALSATKPGAG